MKSKQELIEEWESAIEAAEFYGKGKEDRLIEYMRDFVDDLNQLDESEKPVELQELIEKYSKDSMSTYDVKVERERFVKDLQNLLVPKQEKVDRAYKDGYEKGKEHGFYKGYREGLANKGGEPEVLSQEFINEKAVEVYADTADAEVHVVFRMRDLENLLVPKQEVLSPEWIDKNKRKWTNIQGTKDYVAVEKLQGILVPKQEEITHKQVEKYLLDKNIRVIDIDIYEEMQSELEKLKNSATLSKTETVADVIADFFKSLERLKEVMSMEAEELEE